MKRVKSVIPIGKLKNNLRRLHQHCPHKRKAKARTKVDAATYECESCGIYIYEGSSDKNYLRTINDHPDKIVIKGKLELDHINPVVDVKYGFGSWDDYIHSLWVSEDGYSGLCNSCHADKTSKEMMDRTKHGSLKRK